MMKILTASITLLLLLTVSISSACNVEDHNALIAFKNSFPKAKFPSSWANTDCCTWDSVTCDDDNNHVVSLDFYGPHDYSSYDPPRPIPINLSGSLPESIGDFPFLTELTFHNFANLVGTIPPQITNLKNLIHLTITNTSISGPIPPSLGSLVNLTDIDLSQNQLTGSIPDSIHGIFLYLSNNKLTGTIPKSFANVPTFYDVRLDNNQLSGDASPFFGSKKSLGSLWLNNNHFSFNLSNVEYPESLFYLDLSHNEIYGSISSQAASVKGGFYINVAYNELCGKIPEANFAPESHFDHNKCLCGAPLQPCK